MVALLFRGLLYSVILPAVRLDEGTGSNPGNRSVSATAVSCFRTSQFTDEVAISSLYLSQTWRLCGRVGISY